MTDTRLQLDELHSLIFDILVAHDTARGNAERVAKALVAAEADGQKGHGASRVPSYAGQARSGKVDGHAVPEAIRLSDSAAVIRTPATDSPTRRSNSRSRPSATGSRPRRWRRR